MNTPWHAPVPWHFISAGVSGSGISVDTLGPGPAHDSTEYDELVLGMDGRAPGYLQFHSERG